MKIISEKENKIFNRIEAVVSTGYENVTPTRNDLKKELTKMFKINEEGLIILKILPEYGKKEAKIYLHAYKDEKNINNLEVKSVIKKNQKAKKPEVSEEKTNSKNETKDETKNDSKLESVEKPKEDVKEE